MKFYTTYFLAFSLLASTACSLPQAQDGDKAKPAQPAHLVFKGKKSDYEMTVWAWGMPFEPSDYQYVKYIEAKDFSAVQLCGFEDQFGAGIPTSLQVDYDTGKQYVVLDKEQIVYSVYCDGTCPLVNDNCSTDKDAKACCTGFCEEGRCSNWKYQPVKERTYKSVSAKDIEDYRNAPSN